MIIEEIAASIIAAAAMAAGGLALRKRRVLTMRYRAMMNRFFYSERIVNELMFSSDRTEPSNDAFIRYRDIAEGNLYPGLGIEVPVRHGKETKTFLLPYAEIVNFIDRPQSRITIVRPDHIPQRYPADALTARTRPALNAYLNRPAKRAQTYNDHILCMKSLRAKGPDTYSCELTQSDFLDVVRTNLTLDHPLEGGFRETLRGMDAARAEGKLPLLEDSLLMNFIGVSAVWCMDRGSGAPEERFRYYLKCRQSGMSVYSGMLGTASGYANPPAGDRFDSDDLMQFMRSEMLREFDEETGYGSYARSKGYSLEDERYIKVIPLALTREFARGGCPQFFFLIVTPYIGDREFAGYFKQSIDGRNEFRDDLLSNRSAHPLSPETFANLLYARRYVQQSEKLGFIRL